MTRWNVVATVCDEEFGDRMTGIVEAEEWVGANALGESLARDRFAELIDQGWELIVAVSPITSAEDVRDHARRELL